MYAIKVWSTKEENSWYLMRDLKDHVVHCYGRQEKAEGVVKHLLEENYFDGYIKNPISALRA